jgi:hypothetical protein
MTMPTTKPGRTAWYLWSRPLNPNLGPFGGSLDSFHVLFRNRCRPRGSAPNSAACGLVASVWSGGSRRPPPPGQACAECVILSRMNWGEYEVYQVMKM